MDALIAYRGLLLSGALVTLELAAGSLLLAAVLGLLGAWGKLSGSWLAQRLAGAYTTLIRGVPDLVLLLLLYYGGQSLINAIGRMLGAWEYLEVDQLASGIFAIGLIYGAYMTEVFRGAYLAIPRGQIEAGVACGMTRRLLFRRIVFPQVIRHALPGFTNTWLVQIKVTALVSVIGLEDLVYNAYVAGRAVRQPFTFILVVLIAYLALTALSQLGLRWVERKYGTHGGDRLAHAA
jgi:His/Glu/Gln/Arg/opine family amino acid ABC transporter permease subunit